MTTTQRDRTLVPIVHSAPKTNPLILASGGAMKSTIVRR